MYLVGNMVMVEEDTEEEGKLRMVEEEGKLKDREGKRRLREEEGNHMAEEDRLKLVGMLIAAESIVLVGKEMVQSMVVTNMEMEKAVLSSEVLEEQTVVLMAQTRDVGSAHKKIHCIFFSLCLSINEPVNTCLYCVLTLPLHQHNAV